MGRVKGIEDRIKEAVWRSGKSVRQIEHETGVDHIQIYGWMNAAYMPNAASICKLCKCLDVSADWLLGLSSRKERG